jgi:hypothetical protein
MNFNHENTKFKKHEIIYFLFFFRVSILSCFRGELFFMGAPSQ